MDTCDAAVAALARGELVVLPTDTVYGLGADAFSRAAVTRLLPPFLFGFFAARSLHGTHHRPEA
ncbi:Sua5/YciO/YrdC/YwlC family protein, partial [Actinotignum timonense]|uniref:L-threonylcarbamoyladenylate synthase n=1 Tax=Actinotignum timonense TaxID=1870995 RepID=UPI002A835659